MSTKITYRASATAEDGKLMHRNIWITDPESDFFLTILFLRDIEGKKESPRFRTLGTTRTEVFFLDTPFYTVNERKILELARNSDAKISVFLSRSDPGYAVRIYSKEFDSIIAGINPDGIVDVYEIGGITERPVSSIDFDVEGLKKPKE